MVIQNRGLLLSAYGASTVLSKTLEHKFVAIPLPGKAVHYNHVRMAKIQGSKPGTCSVLILAVWTTTLFYWPGPSVLY